MEMTCAFGGRTIRGAGAAAGAPAVLAAAPNRVTGKPGRAGAPAPTPGRTLFRSPRRGSSAFLGSPFSPFADFSEVLAPGLGRRTMKPILSPTFGAGGGGGGAGGAGGSALASAGVGGAGGGSAAGAASGAGSAEGAAAASAATGAGLGTAGTSTTEVAAIPVANSVAASTPGAGATGDTSAAGAGSGATAVSAGVGTADGVGTASTAGGGVGAGSGGGGGGFGARSSGLAATICCSRYSAVILSSVLEATRAPVMPNSLALARTSLLSMPSLFEIS